MLEVSLAASLLSVVGLSVTGGIRFVTERQEITRQRRVLLDAARAEIANLRGLADAGTLIAGQNTTTPVALGPGRTGQIAVVTSTSLEAPNLVTATVTAQLQTGATPYSIVLQTGFHVIAKPRIISIKFAPLSVPAPASASFFGVVPAPNWNISRNGSITNAASDVGASTLDISATHSGGLDILGNLIDSGASAAGESVQYLFRGANWSWPAPASNVVTISQIPFDRYDILAYVQVPGLGFGSLGSVQLGTLPARDLDVPAANSLARQGYVLNENLVRYQGLSGDTQTITLTGPLGAPPLHAIQVVERR